MGFDRILKILNDDYGIGADYPDPTVISWAIGAVADQFGKQAARSEQSALNRHRRRFGLIPVHVAIV